MRQAGRRVLIRPSFRPIALRPSLILSSNQSLPPFDPISYSSRSFSLRSLFVSRDASEPGTTTNTSSTTSDPTTSSDVSEQSQSSLSLPERIQELVSANRGSSEDAESVIRVFKQAIEREGMDDSTRKEGAKLIVDNWEKLGGWDPTRKLFHHPSAFPLYMSSLLALSQSDSIPKALRIREDLLLRNTSPSTTSSFAGYSPYASNPSSSSGSANSWDDAAGSPAAAAGVASTASGTSASPLGGSGKEPVHVVVDSQARDQSWRGTRPLWFAVGTAIKWFGFATIAVLIMEQAGMVKLGPSVNEFEASKQEGGKIIKFVDVKGVDEAKDELREIVEFLKDPEKFSTLGGRLPKGVLLTGPPGTGKTMLAKAVAGEAGVPFFFASGSEFEEKFVGVGAKRIRELFATAKKKSPAIIFIDELDSVGGKRSSKDQAALKQTVNQLLTELDGFQASTGIIVIAATNFPQSLDPALVRPGRFDRHVAVPLPDVRGRVEILQHYVKDIIADPEVDPSTIARGTPGMSGADLQNLVNQAAVHASREGVQGVRLEDFEWAKDRIMMGAERKSHFVTPESKRMTAYHEGGHALVALLTPGSMPLHKVTVLPRGQALGITFQLPEMDRDSYSKAEYQARIDVAMGGRVAEELIYGKENVTSGAHSDLVAATNVASSMVKELGFSDKVGLVAHGEESVYLSERKKDEIESEIRGMIESAAIRALTLLQTNRSKLDTLANALIRYETLSADEVREVLSSSDGSLSGKNVVDVLDGPSI
ncbi:atp-dependent peptidase [Phaffia rhodozyma]|uniref:Atp-dependent peptidase n=1 Tax=Phaffia rhodozyma TaxID=264483 RepID=A0A0F7SUQ3_PHARH|nr:atp-dependent peptidase [Phaffia rhodozyma]